MSNEDLTDKNLPGADLSNTDLPGANLEDANLSSADLNGANLDGAIGADFTGAKNVPAQYLKD